MDAANHAITLRLEGRVIGPWVAELQKSCEELLGEGRLVKLHLAEVEYLDSDGALLISSLQSRGVSVVECSPFIAKQLTATGTA